MIAFLSLQQKFFSNQSLQKKIDAIPQEDHVALDALFHHLVFENYFAYTLFGNKPMTFHGAFYDQPNSASVFLTNWKIWKKYSKMQTFEMKNYVFKEEIRPELFGVHFINKKNVLRCVRDHIDIFRKELTEDVTPEIVLQTLIENDDLYETLNNSQILYGILFGFGAKNALNFHQKYVLNLPLPEPTPFNNEDPDEHPLPLPYFVTFYPNQETEMLRKQYGKDRERILKMYSKGDFLEITLSKLLSRN